MNAYGLISAFIFSALFVIAFLSFGFNLAIDNNATSTILDDPLINATFVALESQLNQDSKIVNSSKTGFESEDIKENAADVILPSIKSVGTTFFGMSTTIYNLIFLLAFNILNIPSIVLVTMAILIGISIVFLAWKLYRSGQ